jgi:hydroxymethylpyrimidine/phosphomethylpyrimidine kinase
MIRIMIIGGTDSSGGAGLTRDTATATQLGVAVLPVVTAVTAQTDTEVSDVALMTPALVAAQISAGLKAGEPLCVKIGMLGTKEVAEAVADALANGTAPVVLDPELTSSSGKCLLAGGMPKSLIARAHLITPNLMEATTLTGSAMAQTHAQLMAQSNALLEQGARAVLIKGGHGEGAEAVDYLCDATTRHRFKSQRLATGKRGTGCTLATAIACYLAQGDRLDVACDRAKTFVHAWLMQ